MKFQDLSGMIFGRLTVIEYYGKNERNRPLWICKCSCGNLEEIIVTSANLKNNSTKSCGCYGKEQLFKANKKHNVYELNGEYGIGRTQNGDEFYFDLEDYDLIKDYCWRKTKYGHIYNMSKNKDGIKKGVFLHRLIMGVENSPEIMVDHKNNKHPEDNRKENLRFCTRSQNNQNRSIMDNNNTGISGVGWNKDKRKYVSYIGVNGKTKHLGYFTNFEEAIIARLQAEAYYFSNFAPQSHLFEQYGIIP